MHLLVAWLTIQRHKAQHIVKHTVMNSRDEVNKRQKQWHREPQSWAQISGGAGMSVKAGTLISIVCSPPPWRTMIKMTWSILDLICPQSSSRQAIIRRDVLSFFESWNSRRRVCLWKAILRDYNSWNASIRIFVDYRSILFRETVWFYLTALSGSRETSAL